jgi:cell division protein FtsB
MGDIESRLRRYRLSRYGNPLDPLPRWLALTWIVIILWGVWALAFSNHSFYRLWRLKRENAEAELELKRAQRELDRLEGGMRDPKAVRDLAEHTLREKTGMAKPGEIIYRIRPAHGDSSEAR